MKHLDALAARHPVLALALAPVAGALFVLTLPFLGWFVLIQGIFARIRRNYTNRAESRITVL